VIHNARMSCQIKPHELRAKNNSGAASTVKLPMCEYPYKYEEPFMESSRVGRDGYADGNTWDACEASNWAPESANTRLLNRAGLTTASVPMTLRSLLSQMARLPT
jgi:hypothetical protein